MDTNQLMDAIPNHLLFRTFASMKHYDEPNDPRKKDDEKYVVCCCSNHKILRTSIISHKKTQTHRNFLKPYFNPSPQII